MGEDDATRFVVLGSVLSRIAILLGFLVLCVWWEEGLVKRSGRTDCFVVVEAL